MILSPECPDDEDLEDDKYIYQILQFIIQKIFRNILRSY